MNFLCFPLHIPSDGEFDGLSIVPIFTTIRVILASIEPLQEMPASNMSSKNARDRRPTSFKKLKIRSDCPD